MQPFHHYLFDSTSISFSAGLGVALIEIPGLSDYFNSRTTISRIDEFQGMPEFFFSSEYFLSPTFGAKIEYSYMFGTFTLANDGSLDELVELQMPTIMIQQLYFQQHSILKLGAGIGFHFGSLEETTYGSTFKYHSRGIGLKGEAEANGALSENLYAFISADVRVDFLSTLRANNGNTLNIYSTNNIEHASLNFFSLGLKLGVILYV